MLSPVSKSRTPLTLIGLLLFFCLRAVDACAQIWGHGHGGSDNAGFADVSTRPITNDTPRTVIPNLGTFAPGVGPVVAQNSVAYLGTTEGQIIAIRIDGTAYGTAQLPAGRHILSPLLIGSDGSIYVAASFGQPPEPRDHRTIRAWLYRFTPQLQQLWEKPLPVHVKETGTALALNGTGSGQGEVIAVAAVEKVDKHFQVNLVGFAPDGSLLFNQDVGGSPNPEGGSWITDFLKILCWPFANECRGNVPTVLAHEKPDQLPPGVSSRPIGIAVSSGGVLVVTDGYKGVRGYQYTAGEGLKKVFEKKDSRTLSSAPAVLPTERSVYGVNGGRIAFAGPSTEHVADINHAPGSPDYRWPVEATPTRLANGRVVTVNRFGSVTVIDNVVPIAHADGKADSIAGASASRDVFYVPTVSALLSFDASTNALLESFAWTGGGQSPAAIGNTGAVYVVADNALNIFLAGTPRSPVTDLTGHVPDASAQPVQPATPAPPVIRDHRRHPDR